jgi:hypothetical protein
VQNAFDDLRAMPDDFAKFLGETFDQLESLSLELFARHKCLELSSQCRTDSASDGAELRQQFQQCLDGLSDLKTHVGAAFDEAAKMRSELSTALKQHLQDHAHGGESHEDLGRIAEELQAIRQAAEQDRVESKQKQKGLEEHLQRLENTLAETASAQSSDGNDEQLALALETNQRQQAAWQQERAAIEAKLESERQRNTQQNEALAEQRRLAAEQQAAMTGELKRMRSLIELLSTQMQQPAAPQPTDAKQSQSSENAALESVLAQFEMLQRDLAQRRTGDNKDLAKH